MGNYEFIHTLFLVAVILSVCPSVKRVLCDNLTKQNKLMPKFLYHMLHKSSIHLVFSQEEWFVGDDPLYLKFWAELTPLLRKHRFSIDFRGSVVTRTTVLSEIDYFAHHYSCGNCIVYLFIIVVLYLITFRC